MDDTRTTTRGRRTLLTPAGWWRAGDVIADGYIGSQAALDRALRRSEYNNPFPAPARDPESGHRFWRPADVEDWAQRERDRLAARLVLPEPGKTATSVTLGAFRPPVGGPPRGGRAA